jgi:hypothetical protein
MSYDPKRLMICAFHKICQANCCHKFTHDYTHMDVDTCQESLCSHPVVFEGDYYSAKGNILTLKSGFPNTDWLCSCVSWEYTKQFKNKYDIIDDGVFPNDDDKFIYIVKREYDKLDHNKSFYLNKHFKLIRQRQRGFFERLEDDILEDDWGVVDHG